MSTPLDPTTPLLGYNNNIPYKGQVYHVQTEDSGSKHPHVITHLFADGGRVVNTTKTSYEHLLGGDNLSEKVRALMRDQHKKMVIALRDGEFDERLDLGEAAASEDDGAAVHESVPAEAIVDASQATPEEGRDLGPPSEPIELLDGVPSEAAVPGSPLAPTPPVAEAATGDALLSPPSADDSPGTYSFVGSRSSPPPRRASDPSMSVAGPVSQPPRRPIPTAPPQRRIRPSAPTPSEAPPAIERTAPRRISRPPAPGPGPALEPAMGVVRGGAARHHATVPDPSAAAAHAASVFGERFITPRTFDEVVTAFLRGQS